jgi:hypothetical protein
MRIRIGSFVFLMLLLTIVYFGVTLHISFTVLENWIYQAASLFLIITFWIGISVEISRLFIDNVAKDRHYILSGEGKERYG